MIMSVCRQQKLKAPRDQYALGQSAVKSTFLASAIRKCGGKDDRGIFLYSAYGSSGQLAVMSEFLDLDQAATEALLAQDPDVSPWVQKYQRSRETGLCCPNF